MPPGKTVKKKKRHEMAQLQIFGTLPHPHSLFGNTPLTLRSAQGRQRRGTKPLQETHRMPCPRAVDGPGERLFRLTERSIFHIVD